MYNSYLTKKTLFEQVSKNYSFKRQQHLHTYKFCQNYYLFIVTLPMCITK